jgi:hypothetical protein
MDNYTRRTVEFTSRGRDSTTKASCSSSTKEIVSFHEILENPPRTYVLVIIL